MSRLPSGSSARSQTAYPTYSGPLLNLGILQVKAGRFEDAEKSLRGAVERNGNNAQAFNQLGIVYRKLGRFKEADERVPARGADRSELRASRI